MIKSFSWVPGPPRYEDVCLELTCQRHISLPKSESNSGYFIVTPFTTVEGLLTLCCNNPTQKNRACQQRMDSVAVTREEFEIEF